MAGGLSSSDMNEILWGIQHLGVSCRRKKRARRYIVHRISFPEKTIQKKRRLRPKRRSKKDNEDFLLWATRYL